MAGPAGGGRGHVRYFADVVSVDLRDHLDHQPRALLFVFGIRSEIAFGQIIIHFMAKVASHSQLRGETFHHLHEFGLLDVRRKDPQVGEGVRNRGAAWCARWRLSRVRRRCRGGLGRGGSRLRPRSSRAS